MNHYTAALAVLTKISEQIIKRIPVTIEEFRQMPSDNPQLHERWGKFMAMQEFLALIDAEREILHSRIEKERTNA